MFSKMKDLYNMQKQAKAMKKELQSTLVEAEVGGVLVTLNLEMNMVDLKIAPEALTAGVTALENNIKEAYQKARKKAEELAAVKMKDIMGGMGLPGM
ncbi:hypothetical protein COB57_00585 [Candidatus Peregrinibacteria bacterium]|nr:MAG: hypothetical protein COB57_00585 [Candidatus Peregrinibacteria bacterium]